MKSSDITEIGAMTVVDEVLRRKQYLTSIWGELSSEHPLDVIADVLGAEPMVDRIARAIGRVDGVYEKERIILAGPELVALEALKKLALPAEIFVAVDRSVPDDVIKRVARNVPDGLQVNVSRDLPNHYLGPTDTLFLAVGLQGGYRLALLPSWISSVSKFYASVFTGERILIDPVGPPIRWRRSLRFDARSTHGWVTELIQSCFTDFTTPDVDDNYARALNGNDSQRMSSLIDFREV